MFVTVAGAQTSSGSALAPTVPPAQTVSRVASVEREGSTTASRSGLAGIHGVFGPDCSLLRAAAPPRRQSLSARSSPRMTRSLLLCRPPPATRRAGDQFDPLIIVGNKHVPEDSPQASSLRRLSGRNGARIHLHRLGIGAPGKAPAGAFPRRNSRRRDHHRMSIERETCAPGSQGLESG